jgi:hypothetical protein
MEYFVTAVDVQADTASAIAIMAALLRLRMQERYDAVAHLLAWAGVRG